MTILANDRLPDSLQAILQTNTIQATIAVQARADSQETGFLLALAQDTPWIAGVVGWEDLCADDLVERLASWQHPKLLGWRHQVQDEPDVPGFLARPDFNRGVALVQQLGYVYDVLVTQQQLPQIPAFCARHDQHWLVLDHLGKPALREFDAPETVHHWRQHLQTLAAMPHVVCKLSGLVTEADWRAGLQTQDLSHIRLCLDLALAAFGPQRLMFGSDWPVCLLAASYADVAQLVTQWSRDNLHPDEQAALWGGTAARCYGMTDFTDSIPG